MSQCRPLACVTAAVGLVLGGCASRIAGVPPPEVRTVPASLADTTGNCSFRLDRIEDQRESRVLSERPNDVITDEGIVDWLASSVAQIPGYRPDAVRAIRLELLKAYFERRGDVIQANIVVRLYSDLQAEGRVYRGLNARTHLLGVDEGDVHGAFDRAMGDLIVRIAHDEGNWCHT